VGSRRARAARLLPTPSEVERGPCGRDLHHRISPHGRLYRNVAGGRARIHGDLCAWTSRIIPAHAALPVAASPNSRAAPADRYPGCPLRSFDIAELPQLLERPLGFAVWLELAPMTHSRIHLAREFRHARGQFARAVVHLQGIVRGFV